MSEKEKDSSEEKLPAVSAARDVHITYNTPTDEQGNPLVNEKVMACLVKNLEEKDLQLSDKQSELDKLVEKYIELCLALHKREDTDDFAAKAKECLEEGDLEGAEKYLNNIANRLSKIGLKCKKEAIVGRVAESLVDYCVKGNVDLIIIATHGHSGITRWVRGSVADKILRSSTIPVMMVRAPGTEEGV